MKKNHVVLPFLRSVLAGLTFLSAYAHASPNDDLVVAARDNNVQEVLRLLAAGANPNYETAQDVDHNCNYGFNDHSFALRAAFHAGASDAFKILLEHGAHVQTWVNFDQIRSGNSCAPILSVAFDLNKTPEVLALIQNHTELEYTTLSASDQTYNHETKILWRAVKTKRLDLLKVLIAAGASIDPIGYFSDQFPYQVSALGAAILNEDEVAIDLLLKSGASANSVITDQVSNLYLAVLKHNFPLVQRLIGLGANINQMVPLPDNTVTKFALRQNDMSLFEFFMRLSPRLGEFVHCDDSTELSIAVDTKNRVGLKTLLAAGAAPDMRATLPGAYTSGSCQTEGSKQFDSLTPLMRAISSRQVDVAMDLLQAGADVNAQDGKGFTALMKLAQLGENPAVYSVAKAILARKPNLALSDTSSDIEASHPLCATTALNYAMASGAFNLANLFLDAGANPNSFDYTKHESWNLADKVLSSAFLRAVGSGSVEMVKRFVDANVDLKQTDRFGRNAMLLSGPLNSPAFIPMTRYLTSLGVDPKSHDHLGQDLFHLIFTLNPNAVGTEIKITSLLSMGLDINSKNGAGSTPLMYASGLMGKTFPESIKVLLENGADPSLKNNRGMSALDYLKNSGDAIAYKAFCEVKPTYCGN